jgi:tetratricopeptide (TPR) repeat protein
VRKSSFAILNRSAVCRNVGRSWRLGRCPPRGRFAGAAIVLTFCACCFVPPGAAALPQASEQKPATAVAQISKEATEFILQGFDLLGQHNARGAEAAFRQAIEVQPEAQPAHRGLGLALREEGRLTDAFRELQTATRLDPSDADAHYALGSVAWALSTPASSAPGKTGGLTPADYQNLAAAEFSEALTLSPKDATLRMSLAAIYLEADRPHDALRQAEEAVHIAPGSAAAHVTLGRAYFAGGEEEKAAAEFQAAQKLDPQDGAAYLALGQLRMFQRRNPQAEEALRHAIQVSPNLGPAYAALAQILTEEGKGAEARGLLETAVRLNPQDWQSQYQLAVLFDRAGESARAAELLKQVLRTNPDFPAAREQLATQRLRRGDAKGATSLAGSMIAENPQGPEGHRIMALALWKQRDYEGSLAECAMALNADPNSIAMEALQAIELWQLGHKKEAQSALREAARLEPKVASSDVFCRLLLCDAHDINIVSDFLRKIRWVLAPPPTP